MSESVNELEEVRVETGAGVEIHDLSGALATAIGRSGLRDGLAVVHVPGSTGAVTTIEYESGLVEDLTAALERLAPEGIHYAHNARWGDGNGHSHVRASLMGPSLSIPVRGGEPVLGTWQQVVFVQLDNRPRSRRIVIQLLGRR